MEAKTVTNLVIASMHKKHQMNITYMKHQLNITYMKLKLEKKEKFRSTQITGKEKWDKQRHYTYILEHTCQSKTKDT